jgi:hypothetical protein
MPDDDQQRGQDGDGVPGSAMLGGTAGRHYPRPNFWHQMRDNSQCLQLQGCAPTYILKFGQVKTSLPVLNKFLKDDYKVTNCMQTMQASSGNWQAGNRLGPPPQNKMK